MKLSNLKVMKNGKQQPLPPLWTNHIDQGETTVLFDNSGKIIETTDAKDAITLSAYDKLSRNTHIWAIDKAGESFTLRQVIEYGDNAGLTNPENENLIGQVYQHYDEAGKIKNIEFDFKGNLLSTERQCISDSELLSVFNGPPANWDVTPYVVDWTGFPSILDTKVFETDIEYDALNRVTKVTYPEDTNSNRKIGLPTYNTAGALQSVEFDGTDYVNHIGYNAKGQRLIIAFGNNTMTRYVYDNKTFRLSRMKSEEYTQSDFEFTPVSSSTKQDHAYTNDLVGNIVEKLIRVNDCGIDGTTEGSNALNRVFQYDPLYRVKYADGRESDTQHNNDYLYSDAPAPGSPNASYVRAYTRKYQYDKIGNVQQVLQPGTEGFTRNFVYNTGVNTLQEIENASSVTIQSFTYDDVGNQITAGTTRNYVWNAANELITYYNQAGGSDPTIFAQYDYSGGNRVSKLVRTGTAGSPIYERVIYIDGIFEYHILENGTTYEKNYVHIMDDKSRIAMVRVGDQFPDDILDAITYNLEDQIGSSTVRLKTSGGVIDKEEYYPFGDSSLRTFSKKRYRYVGKEKDLESGLYYYGARYYAAWTCRFISVDPLAADYAHLTPYNNAGNKVVNSVDIDGMQGENETKSEGSNNIESELKSGTASQHKIYTKEEQRKIIEVHNAKKRKQIEAIKDRYNKKINEVTEEIYDVRNERTQYLSEVYEESGFLTVLKKSVLGDKQLREYQNKIEQLITEKETLLDERKQKINEVVIWVNEQSTYNTFSGTVSWFGNTNPTVNPFNEDGQFLGTISERGIFEYKPSNPGWTQHPRVPELEYKYSTVRVKETKDTVKTYATPTTIKDNKALPSTGLPIVESDYKLFIEKKGRK